MIVSADDLGLVGLDISEYVEELPVELRDYSYAAISLDTNNPFIEIYNKKGELLATLISDEKGNKVWNLAKNQDSGLNDKSNIEKNYVPPKPTVEPTGTFQTLYGEQTVETIKYDSYLDKWVGLDSKGRTVAVYLEGYDNNTLDDIYPEGTWAAVYDIEPIEVNGFETNLYILGFSYDDIEVFSRFNTTPAEYIAHYIRVLSESETPQVRTSPPSLLKKIKYNGVNYSDLTPEEALSKAFTITYQNRSNEFSEWDLSKPIIIIHSPNIDFLSTEARKHRMLYKDGLDFSMRIDPQGRLFIDIVDLAPGDYRIFLMLSRALAQIQDPNFIDYFYENDKFPNNPHIHKMISVLGRFSSDNGVSFTEFRQLFTYR